MNSKVFVQALVLVALAAPMLPSIAQNNLIASQTTQASQSAKPAQSPQSDPSGQPARAAQNAQTAINAQPTQIAQPTQPPKAESGKAASPNTSEAPAGDADKPMESMKDKIGIVVISLIFAGMLAFIVMASLRKTP